MLFSEQHWVTCLLPLLGLLSSLTTAEYAVKESHYVSDNWSRVSRALPHQGIKLHIGLKQDRFHELSAHLLEVSHPSNQRYGQHLSVAEVNGLVRPSEHSLGLVKAWLNQHGITDKRFDYSPAQDWITVQLTIIEVEDLLQTKYYIFKNAHDERAVRALEFSLPEELHDHIDVVQPTTAFFSPSQSRRSKDAKSINPQHFQEEVGDRSKNSPTLLNLRSEGIPPHTIGGSKFDGKLSVKDVCNSSAITPLCLRTLYGTIDYQPKVSENTMALTNFLGESNNQSDIHQFLSAYRSDAALAGAAYNFTIEEIAGGYNRQSPSSAQQLAGKEGKEGNLDAEVMIGIGFPTRLITYSTAGDPPFQPDDFRTENTNEPFLNWLQYVLAHPNPPSVISTSYGDVEQTVPYAYAKRVCESFAQLGARGVTLLFGAGDFGVGKNGTCHDSPAGNNSTHSKPTKFLATFPESCPYGTSVGATRDIDPEVVAYNENNGFVSGGGFSNYFPRPTYQDHVVTSYLDRLGDEHEGLFNRTGRAYPDIATQGYRFVTVWNGTEELVDGTSASAPTMASIIALVNDALVSQGKPTLGFLNPWLYERGFEAFTDIISGSTKGCGTRGFPAMSGWDVASGFGTPWFPKLVELARGKEIMVQLPWYY